MSNWQKFCSVWQRIQYYLIFLSALWLSLGVPGCSFSPPNSQTASSPSPTQINPTAQHFDGVTINVITHDEAIYTGAHRRIAGFEALTGAKVNLTGVPFKNLYNILEKNWSGSVSKYDMTIDWGDIGPLSIDQSVSKVMDKVGAVITPGTTQVLDHKTSQLVSCDKFTCPYAIDGVNHAPYAANVGWTGVIHTKAAANVKNAAYRFLSYMSQPAQSNVDVTIGTTGFNPYRISQFENSDPWIKSGMSSEAANNYLGAIGVSLNSPNIVLNLSIPHNQQYQFEVLDAAVSDFLVNKLTTEKTMQHIEQGWEQITNAVGRESQRAAYRASLGL